jgi:catechol 2,3-dioxygenase-like lactoylglutathione lyase family enzyme
VDVRLDLVGIVAHDMKTSLEFYRRLGLEISEGAEDEPHAEATTPSGLRVAWDSAELIQQIDPAWTEPSGGHRIALAFLCSSPEQVDAKYDELFGPRE